MEDAGRRYEVGMEAAWSAYLRSTGEYVWNQPAALDRWVHEVRRLKAEYRLAQEGSC